MRLVLMRHARSTNPTLQLVLAYRGVSVLQDWLLEESAVGLPIRNLRIGASALHKSIDVGMRRSDAETDYFSGFLEVARRIAPTRPSAQPSSVS